MWRCILPPTCECCSGQTPHCSPPTRRFFHRPPLPGLRPRRVCCRPAGRPPRRPLLATMGAIKIGARRGWVSTTSCRPTKRPDQLPPGSVSSAAAWVGSWAVFLAAANPNPFRPDVGDAHEHDVDVPVGDEESPERLVGVGLVDGGWSRGGPITSGISHTFCSGTFEFLSHHICYTALTPYGPVSFVTLSCCTKLLIYLPYSVPYCGYTTFLLMHWFLWPTFPCLLGDRGWWSSWPTAFGGPQEAGTGPFRGPTTCS